MIRLVEEKDAGELLAIYTPYVRDTIISCEYDPPSEEEFLHRIRMISADYPYLVEEMDGIITGYAYAHRFMERTAYQWNAEVSIYVRQDQHRKGIGRELYKALFQILRLQHVQNLYAIISSPNPASIAFHERLGFEKVGEHRQTAYKFHAWLDTVYYHLSLGNHESPPRPFLPIDRVDIRTVIS